MPAHVVTLLAAAALAVPPAVARAGQPACTGPEPPSVSAVAALPPIDAGTALLVIAPHPDDEILCCGGVIQRVLRAGGHATVVWLTSGDGSLLDLLAERPLFGWTEKARALGLQRMAEARAATAALGVTMSAQLFLGYPDRGLSELLGAHRSAPYTSRLTDAAAVPYPGALFPGHPYTGESLERDLTAVLERVHPTLILAPSPRDSHPDHRAAGLLTIAVSAQRAMLPAVRYWIVHGGEGWPAPRGLLAGVPLTPAPLAVPLAPAAFTLEPAEEDRKLLALQAYRSQLRVLAPFLLAFVRTTELFSARAAAAPSLLPPPAPPPP
jgi:LmbE family N-acetylglucosaminyl deacetylase